MGLFDSKEKELQNAYELGQRNRSGGLISAVFGKPLYGAEQLVGESAEHCENQSEAYDKGWESGD
jgi:hypothetical protein